MKIPDQIGYMIIGLIRDYVYNAIALTVACKTYVCEQAFGVIRLIVQITAGSAVAVYCCGTESARTPSLLAYAKVVGDSLQSAPHLQGE